MNAVSSYSYQETDEPTGSMSSTSSSEMLSSKAEMHTLAKRCHYDTPSREWTRHNSAIQLSHNIFCGRNKTTYGIIPDPPLLCSGRVWQASLGGWGSSWPLMFNTSNWESSN